MKKIALYMSLLSVLILQSCDSSSEEGMQDQAGLYEQARVQEENIRVCRANALENPIVSDQFEIYTRLDGTELFVRIDTDLPDFAEVSVYVYRSYYQGSTEYYFNYFGAASCLDGVSCNISPENRDKLIGYWRTGESIILDNDVWKSELRQSHSRTQELLRRLGSSPSRIDRVEEDSIQVSATVHVNQEDCRFGGRGNPALTGSAVTDIGDGRNVMRAEMEIDFPISW